MKQLLISGLLIAVVLVIAGCPSKQEADQSSRADSPASVNRETAGSAQSDSSRNLFENTPMVVRPPNNLGMNHSGDKLYANVVPTSSDPIHYVSMFDLTDGGLSNAQSVIETKMLGKAYLSVHPTEPRCLLVKASQTADKRVVDRVIEGKLNVEPLNIKIDDIAGIPEDGPHDDLLGVTPLYSWDGRQVIIPLTGSGIVIFDIKSRERTFYAYPQVSFTVTGKAIQAIEDQNGKHRIVLSFWSAGMGEDACSLYTFDLDSREYTAFAEDLKWIVYQVASPDYDNEPWLISGSRGKLELTETSRTPLIARLDPSGSGVFDPVMFYGNPVWRVELDARGENVVYADRQRKALVRLKPATGLLESDPAVYSENEDATILLNNDASRVLLWDGRQLQQVRWQNQEDFTGYDE